MGNLYNLLNGVNPAIFFILPMLGKHPDDYPRFRDCFVNKDNQIVVYTRVGGGNRNSGYGEEELYKHPDFVETYDDDLNNTYGYYVFNVPEKWKEDFDKFFKKQKPSEEYIEHICSIYPKIAGEIKEIFSRFEENDNNKQS